MKKFDAEKLFFDKLTEFLYPPQNRVLGGYTVFSMSVIPSFRQHLRVLRYITSIAFVRFYSYLHHSITIRQCMFGRKIRAEGSVLQELFYFVILTIRYLYYNR